MVVERVGLDRVKAKLAGLKRGRSEAEGGGESNRLSIEEIQRRIEEKEKLDAE